MRQQTTADSTWNDFAKTAVALARSFDKHWDKDVASEYTRMVKGKCSPDRALSELRRIASEEGRMPMASEVVAAAREAGRPDRWITFEREVIGHGKRSFARQVPNDGTPPEDHLLPGETLLADTAEPPGTRCQWQECEEGRQFHAMFEKKFGSKPKILKQLVAAGENKVDQ